MIEKECESKVFKSKVHWTSISSFCDCSEAYLPASYLFNGLSYPQVTCLRNTVIVIVTDIFRKMPAEGKVFRLEEVKEHNISKGEAQSIWTVIHDKVYDITKFLDEVCLTAYFYLFLSTLLFSILVVRRS